MQPNLTPLQSHLQNYAALLAIAMSVEGVGILGASTLAADLDTQSGRVVQNGIAIELNADNAAIWRGTFELYAPLPFNTDTTTSINGTTTEARSNLGDLLSNLQWASSIRASVEKGRLGLLTDLSYSKLGEEASRRIHAGRIKINESAQIQASQGIYDFAVRYRIGDPESAIGKRGQFSVIPYVGVRLIDATLNVSAQVRSAGVNKSINESFGHTWAQPLIGSQATVFLAPRLRGFARADIGGFGLSGSSDLSGIAQLGLGYAIGNSTDLNISWRYFGIDYYNGGRPNNGFSSYQNGLEIGLKVFF